MESDKTMRVATTVNRTNRQHERLKKQNNCCLQENYVQEALTCRPKPTDNQQHFIHVFMHACMEASLDQVELVSTNNLRQAPASVAAHVEHEHETAVTVSLLFCWRSF